MSRFYGYDQEQWNKIVDWYYEKNPLMEWASEKEIYNTYKNAGEPEIYHVPDDPILKAARKMSLLIGEGDCPWREGTSSYEEWWAERKEAADEFNRLYFNRK